MVPVAMRTPNITNMLENCIQTTCVYGSKNPIWLLYIYIWWNYLRLNWAKFFKFSYISKIFMFTLSIGTSPFEVLPLCLRNSQLFTQM